MTTTTTDYQEEVCPRCGGDDFCVEGETTQEGKFNLSTCRMCEYQMRHPVTW